MFVEIKEHKSLNETTIYIYIHPSSYPSIQLPVVYLSRRSIDHSVNCPATESHSQSTSQFISQPVHDLRSADRGAEGVEESGFISQDQGVAFPLTKLLRGIRSHRVQQILHRLLQDIQVQASKHCAKTKCGIEGSALSSKAHLSPQNIFTLKQVYDLTAMSYCVDW